jgi:hypothetical protein
MHLYVQKVGQGKLQLSSLKPAPAQSRESKGHGHAYMCPAKRPEKIRPDFSSFGNRFLGPLQAHATAEREQIS